MKFLSAILALASVTFAKDKQIKGEKGLVITLSDKPNSAPLCNLGDIATVGYLAHMMPSG